MLDELRQVLAPYADPRGGYRCPLEGCRAPIRLLEKGSRLVGCAHARDLERLALEATQLLPGSRRAAA